MRTRTISARSRLAQRAHDLPFRCRDRTEANASERPLGPPPYPSTFGRYRRRHSRRRSQLVRHASRPPDKQVHFQTHSDRSQPVRSPDHARDLLVRDRTIVSTICDPSGADERSGIGVDASKSVRGGRIFAPGDDYVKVPIRQFPSASARSYGGHVALPFSTRPTAHRCR